MSFKQQSLVLALGLSLSSWGVSAIAQTNPNLKPQLLAQNPDLVNNCNDGESMFVAAETRGFWINICGGDNPYDYVAVSKRDGASIRLKLRSYNRDQFVAVNGTYRYTLTPSRLRVTDRGRTLVNQPITRWN